MYTEPDGLFAGPPEEPDRYRLIAAAGGGGEGNVFRSTLTVEGRALPVAVKMFRPRPGDPPERFARIAERWRRQLHLVQSIRHPSVVRMRESFVGTRPHGQGEELDGDALYLVMDWVEGTPATVWAAANPQRTYADVAAIVTAAAAGLTHLHSGVDTGGQPILHRDVKPENTIITPAGQIVLVDFGLAHGEDVAAGAGGTPGYIAPEVRAGGEFTPRSDLFGLAGLAYFLFCGSNPPGDADPTAVTAGLAAAPLLAHLPDVRAAIAAGLAPDPAARPADVTAWARGLRDSAPSTVPLATGATEVDMAPIIAASRERDRPRSRWPWVAAVAALLLAAGVAGAWTLADDGDADTDDGLGDLIAAAETTTTEAAPTTTEAPTTTTTERTTTTRPTTTTTAAAPAATPTRLWVRELNPVDTRYTSANEGVEDSNGVTYAQAIRFDGCEEQGAYLDYDLGRDWNQLTTAVGLTDDTRAGSQIKVTIYFDSIPVYERVLGLGESEQLDLDVTNILRVRFEAVRISPYNTCGDVVLGDPRLTRD